MANDFSVRTNYFRVKDNNAFEKFINNVYSYEEKVELWKKEKDNETYYAFACYGNISGYIEENEEENGYYRPDGYDAFIEGLRKLVADDDAVIILEVGYEKLRYIKGNMTIITKSAVENISMEKIGKEIAGKMLGNERYETEIWN